MTGYDAKHWRDRSKEIRALSEDMRSEAKAIMARLADDYDKMAERAAVRAELEKAK